MNEGLLSRSDARQSVSVTPLRVTTITSGTGTFTPLARTKWMRVTLLGGGAAGNSTSGIAYCSAGAAAKPISHWLKKDKSSYPYAIGAGGTGVGSATGNSGGDTTFDTLTAYGAMQGGPTPNTYWVGPAGESSGYGKGGAWQSGINGSNASGYGAGGGGCNGNGFAGGNGSGGLILVEEY